MKIYLIEGLPGSGKTTIAKKLSKFLNTRNVDNICYSEGDLHPVDLAWIAIFNEDELNKLFSLYPSLTVDINKNIKKIKDKYYLAYTKISISEETKDFYDYCSRYEIYKVNDLKVFYQAHEDLWLSFLEENQYNNIIYIFECIFLQNHINELILNYGLKEKEISSYFNNFERLFKNHNVFLFYIKQKNISNTLKKITFERRTNNKALYKDWIDHVVEYLSNIKQREKISRLFRR